MKRTVTKSVFCLAALVILAGCAGRVRYPAYYTLNLPAPPDPPAAENVHATLVIREFRAPAYLRQGAIVYKTSPEQIGFYAYDRWALDPRDFVTNSIVDRLRASGAFAQVKSYDGSRDIDYVLSGRLEKLEELDYQGGVKVQVAISAEMTGIRHRKDRLEQCGFGDWRGQPARCARRGPEMNRTMQRAIEKLVTPMPTSLATGAAGGQKDQK